jgi:two-component SAPR family response regulator
MKILVVEDELDSLNEIVDYLRSCDSTIEIRACSDPMQAIVAGRSEAFDLALLDIQMPEMTGFELAECLSALTSDIRFIFITAYNHYATEAFDLNAIDYVLKPIRQDRFNKAIEKARREVADKKKTGARTTGDIRIQAFGKLVVSYGEQILKWRRNKSAEIFAYLLQQQGFPVHKEKLCEMMWPEYDPHKALAYLQTIMYQLRKNIAEIGEHAVVIEYADHCYRLYLDYVPYDVDQFLEACDLAFKDPQPTLDTLIRAEQCYTGPYLEEDGWIWAIGRQQALARKYQRVLESIIKIEMNGGRKDDALYHIQKLASLDLVSDEEYYLNWVRNNIGPDALAKLEIIISDGK